MVSWSTLTITPSNIDLALIMLVAFGIFIGLAQGLIRQALTLVSLYVALVLSAQYYPFVGMAMGYWVGGDPSARNTLALLLSFAVFAVTLTWASRFIYTQTGLLGVPLVDQAGGAAIGFISSWALAGVLLSLLTFASAVPWGTWDAERLSIRTDLSRSAVAPLASSALPIVYGTLRPWLPLGLPVPFVTQ
jgi:uncharacterized membrane protein required for colicin V production